MKTYDIRKAFLDTFHSWGHEIVPSSGLVPENDPTLLFTTAGMVQFKELITGKEKASYTTAVSCQKCVRAGGKHNDLEQVGYTARHHTFFEMLGNFSFGDYFKERAIYYAWNFLTGYLKISKEKLYVTVYHSDLEAAQWWKKIAGLPDSRILFIKSQDNFWSMGDTGPCGPCSEIFFDHGAHMQGGLPGTDLQDGPRFVELWNLVFMQFERTSQGDVLLKNPCIDTGMGLERIASVMQGVHDNFRTDVLGHIVNASKSLCPGVSKRFVSMEDLPHRVMADHLRSASFLMADGVLPSHEGRGYVLRRIIRRALRFGSYIGTALDHLSALVTPLLESMGATYPELGRGSAVIQKTLLHEAERFEHTLAQGLRFIEGSKSCIQNGIFPGDKAFQLYDTYGVPVDLMQDILSDEGVIIDHDTFEACLEAQKTSSRHHSLGSQGKDLCDEETQNFWNTVAAPHKASKFCGYHALEHTDHVELILDLSEKVPLVELRGQGCIVTQTTPFYAESGGQIGDRGWVKGPHGVMEVTHTEQKNHLFIHHGTMHHGVLKEGDTVLLSVDVSHRKRVQSNHSATHLLHSALRHVLGNHVTQKGSLVTADRLRFDFSHPKGLLPEELLGVEEWVNEKIWANLPVQGKIMTQEAALQAGAIALFGEKYTHEVRVIYMGESQDIISMELCGGTHVASTGEIGLFKIFQESSIGSGLRRIEAVTQQASLNYVQKIVYEQKKLTRLLKTTPEGLEEKISRLLSLAKQTPSISCTLERVHHMQGSLWWGTLYDVEPKAVKPWIDTLRREKGFDVGIFWLTYQGKHSVYLAVQENRAKTHNALSVLKHLYQALDMEPQGGGYSTLAQGKWQKDACKTKAIEHIFTIIKT